jgi:starch phosphorylase
MEASGTSGMKATLNGAINVSILDGWWAEANNPNTGWAIGRGEEYHDQEYQNEVESNALFDLLEKEIIPLFYTRSVDDLPRGWISKMKTAMLAIGSEFNTNRMVRQYTEEMYLPALQRSEKLIQANLERAKQLAAWKHQIRSNWNNLKILDVKFDKHDNFKVGDECTVHCWLALGKLKPDDVAVEMFYGPIDAKGEIVSAITSLLQYSGSTKDGTYEFVGTIVLTTSGRMGHTVRVLPKHPDLDNPFHEGLILWA